jgi:hypothetical protein
LWQSAQNRLLWQTMQESVLFLAVLPWVSCQLPLCETGITLEWQARQKSRPWQLKQLAVLPAIRPCFLTQPAA